MIVKPDWNVFKLNFSENPQKNFEWMCYLLFCREFGKGKGIPRFYNQPALETEPITHNNDVIGFQAKFYTVNLIERKQEILKIIQGVKTKYPNLTILYFYTNQDWTAAQTSDDKKTKVQTEIENEVVKNEIKIEWRTKSFFESEFVTIKNSDITQYFFDIKINDYYKKIRALQPKEIALLDDKIYQTSLYTDEQEFPLTGQNVLCKYIIDQLENKDLEAFPDIFVKGIAGIGKSTEMKIAYNTLLEKLSNDNSFIEFKFLPTPYFFELKNYQKGFFSIVENEKSLLFLDGLDEISNSSLFTFTKEIQNLKSISPSIRFIISGRDGAFQSEINTLKHTDIRLSFYIDSELQNLMYQFRGTLFEPFIGIPFYRNFLINQNHRNIKTYKDFIKALILFRLKDDKRKTDISENISISIGNGINIENIQDKLANFSNELFKSSKKTFSINELKRYFNENEIWFILKSTLIEYQNEKNISFCSNIYFEYFLALYYSKQKFSVIEKTFFLPTGKVIVQYANIIAILMNIIFNKPKIYGKLAKKLKHETSAYILLTDYQLLSAKERYNWYNEIIKEFNNAKAIIYYGRFVKTRDLLNNIDSLSDSIHNLLPEEYYDDAVRMHCADVNKFLENPTSEKITVFENAVILLGLYSKFWKRDQEATLKKVSIPLIKFFIHNPLAEKMQSLLSVNMFFSWYEDYEWTTDWQENDWKAFFKTITNIDNDDFYSFNSEDDFQIKLKLFIHFHSNNYIHNLLVPLSIGILTNKNYKSGTAVAMPRSLDDEFKSPTIHFDNDIFHFSFAIENCVPTISEVLYILNSVESNHTHRHYTYQQEELYKEVISKLKNNINQISATEIPELYKLFTTYISTDNGMYISDFNEYIRLLKDDQKLNLFDLLLSDLIKNEQWQNLWMLHRSIVFLLDIKDQEKSISLFENLKDRGRVYSECVADIYILNMNSHPLYDLSVTEYPILFQEAVKREETKKKIISQIESKKQLMLENEIKIITNKETFLEEVKNIFQYLDDTIESAEGDTDRGRILDLQYENIYYKIQYDYKEGDIETPIYSSFVLTYLFNHTNYDQSINREYIIKDIEEWFSDDRYFWRYFFWLYICHYKKEEADDFLNKNYFLIEKIKESMEQEVLYFISENDVSIYDGGQNRPWVVPFVHYLSRFYNNKLPKWFDKSKILYFIAYPAWQLSTGYGGVHMNGEFNWENWNSVFDWIESVSGINEDIIIEKALSLLPLLKFDQSITQIVTVFVEKVKTNERYKQKMLDVIIDKTIIEVQRDYKDHNEKSIMNGGALSSFWRETPEYFIDKVYPYVDFSKYNPEDINYCRTMVFEYFCKTANEMQKSKVIKLLKNKISEENCRIYLAKLGYKKAIIKTIDGFLNGHSLKTDYTFYSTLFGKTRTSLFLLKKYLELFKYSLEKNNDRREYLLSYAKSGIIQNATRHNFWFIKLKLNNLIAKRKKNNSYFEGIKDFLSEIEQRVFDDND